MSNNKTAWAALENPQFRKFWIAGTIMGTGQVIQDVTSGWIMTSLTSSALAVALLQTAMSLPVLIIALPAGAIADLVDRRKWMISLLAALALDLTAMATLAANSALTPELLLGLVALAGSLTAAFAPSWMRTVPDVLTGPQIPWGVTLNSTAVNIARLTGATIAGFALSNFWPGAGFLLGSAGYLTLLLTLYFWQRPKASSALPPEPFSTALTGAVQYALHSRDVQRIALRTLAFSIGASALMALLPTLARQSLHLSGFEFSLIWAAFGAGAVTGATALSPLRARLAVDDVLIWATGLIAAGLMILAVQPSFAILMVILLVLGAAWVTAVSSFGVAMGQASPAWVLARMLSLYMLAFQGGIALGSILWGQLGQLLGLSTTLWIAGGMLLVSILLRVVAPMPAANPSQLAPSNHWPEAEQYQADPGAGPVQVSIRYHVSDDHANDFVVAMHEFRTQRLRDGAYNWQLFRSLDESGVYQELFQLATWADHVRQHHRVTVADRSHQEAIAAMQVDGHTPKVSHWISTSPIRRA